MPTTIYDVAQIAGVGISTVSRVFNNSPKVLEKTRQKVMKVAAELAYKPSPIARGLVNKQINLVEIFFSWSGQRFDFRSYWYMEILNGVIEVVQANQNGLLVNTIPRNIDPREVQGKIFHNAVDGILLVAPHLEEAAILRLDDNQVPLMLIGHRTEDPRLDFVDSDNVHAAEQVVDHLVKLGHRKIAIITGPVKTSRNAADRLKGFGLAMKKHGLAFPKGFIQEGDFNNPSGEKGMKRLLALSERPTAVFASDDSMALGAWNAIEKAGLKVGKDLALVGFDDIPEASTQPYFLTTVRQDFRKLGMEAAELLFEKIHDPENWDPHRILIPTTLIVRDSSGPVK